MTFEFEKKEALNKKELEKQKLIRNGIFYGAGLLLILVFLMYRNFRNKKKANLELSHQKHIIEEKQKEILDSIEYAKQIQRALIANHEMVNQTIPDSFVMFKPKDIVSGDFYWATNIVQNDLNSLKSDQSATPDDLNNFKQPLNLFYLAVCDSTGHGVPGAFMSLLNISFMNEAIIEKNITDPAGIFEYVRKKLIENISQSGRQDGMDGILICIDVQNNTLTYCAANNSPLLISDNKIISLPADKMPVGKGEKTDTFTAHSIHVKKGDVLYLYTDGYADQFGGVKGKKFKYKQLENLLLSIHPLPVHEQKSMLEKNFEDWKGGLEQVDDVCIIGIRL
jgi:serine phosphatase RsbU (regulator of sigma subunit)